MVRVVVECVIVESAACERSMLKNDVGGDRAYCIGKSDVGSDRAPGGWGQGQGVACARIRSRLGIKIR